MDGKCPECGSKDGAHGWHPNGRICSRPNVLKSETYECQACKFIFKDKPGPVSCPQCRGIYINWLSYNEV